MATAIARHAATLTHAVQCPMCGKGTEPHVVALPGIRVDLAARRAWIAGMEIALSRKEFDILSHFAHNPDQVVTKQQLYYAVWGYPELPDTTRTVDSHISRLRRKIELATGGPAILQSVWGVGWRLTGPAATA